MTPDVRITPEPLAGVDSDQVSDCVRACVDCARANIACAEACLRERSAPHLAPCVRANLACADIAEATARLLSRYAGQEINLARAFLDTCTEACLTCADECDRQARRHKQCKTCAEACRRCAEACQKLVAALP
jgi:hypothetical protein